MSQNLKANDRFEVKENGLTGTVNGVSFNSIQQEWEYYVTWDSFPNKGQQCYMVNDVKDLWQKLDDIAGALPQGYVNQDPDWKGQSRPNPLSSPVFKDKTSCEHKWVEVGFTHTKTVCYHCDAEKQ